MILDGECTYQRARLLSPAPINGIAIINSLPGCCGDFVLNVLANNSGNPLQNDVNTIINWFDSIVTAASMVLKKWVNGAWVNQAAITSSNYGIFNTFGYYTNSEDQKFISIVIEWAKVLTLLGEGSYKITTSYSHPIFGNSDVDSHEYCLKTYSNYFADGTIRLEYWLTGTTGDIEDDTKFKDFGTLNIYNSLRLNGYFGYPKSTYKSDYIEYNNGQSVYVEDEQTPVFKLKLKGIPFFVHEIIKTDFMMADTLAITDYNSQNNASFVKKFVIKDSGYDPKWYELHSNLASIELQFKQAFNRFRKLRS